MSSEAPYRILVVEDNPLQLQLVTDLFRLLPEAAGRFDVVTVATLAAALHAIEESSFDAVLLDLTLPDSRGLGTFRAVNEAASEMPIIVWSSHADEETALTAMREGAHEYLPKGDISPLQLVRTMRHLIERVRAERKAGLIENALRRTQQELLHIQKLEAVGRLAGGVAHDFNNLLTAIGGNADLLLEHFGDNDEARAEIDEIKHGVERAAALTRQLLAFSRKQVMQPVVLDLRSVVNDMHRLLSRLIGENIDLVTPTSFTTATVRADRGQIEQVIMNLVVNARDAMPRGGRITISIDDVVVTESNQHAAGAPSGSYVRITVADTGVGMRPEVMEHIFEPFFTTKEVGKGTGLGLATVYGIVKQSGGYISVSSGAEQGTTFELLLPHVKESADVGAVAPRPVADGEPLGTILIVEDEKAVRDVAYRVLTRAGYEVIAVADGIEALEIGRGLDAVDVVVTDVIMPRLNGPDLVARLRAIRPDIRVLFTSGYTDNAIFPQGYVSADAGFLAKPFTPASLLEAIRRAAP
ncbi:MAG: response regulator [Gemmatimonadota bacterium]